MNMLMGIFVGIITALIILFLIKIIRRFVAGARDNFRSRGTIGEKLVSNDCRTLHVSSGTTSVAPVPAKAEPAPTDVGAELGARSPASGMCYRAKAGSFQDLPDGYCAGAPEAK